MRGRSVILHVHIIKIFDPLQCLKITQIIYLLLAIWKIIKFLQPWNFDNLNFNLFMDEF